jgi:hypothetical protein
MFFWKILEILKKHSPQFVILENVKNLKTHDGGKTLKIVKSSLKELGYHIRLKILDTCKVTTIPQRRERIYIVCFKDKIIRDKFHFDFPEVKNKKIKDLLEEEVDGEYYYDARYKVFDVINENVVKTIDENVLYQYRRYYVRENKSNCCPTLTANMGGGGHNVPLLRDDNGVRKLTPRECFNLQGFPKKYKLEIFPLFYLHLSRTICCTSFIQIPINYIHNIYQFMDNKKVAVLLIGNMRSFNITFKNLETYLLKPYKCDLYICTYDKRFNMKNNTREEIMTGDVIHNLYGNYLKHLVIIPQDTFLERYARIDGKKYTFERILDRLYTIQKLTNTAYEVFNEECIKNNLQYDFVVRMRPDILLNEKFAVDFSVNDDQIIVPTNNSGGGFNDHIAYGRQHVMTKYLTYYNFFHNIDMLNDGEECDVSYIEAGLRKHLQISKIEIIRRPIKYTLLRDTKPYKIVYTGKGQFYIKRY